MSEQKESKRPTHAIYVVHGEDTKARWIKIGAAWMHKDKKGANLFFDALPSAGGRVVLREPAEDQATEETTGTGGQQ